jgi:hypothetical protein
MAIKINSLQGVSTMSVNGTNRYPRVDPRINRRQNPLWTFPDTFQGTVAGYASGAPPATNVIDKFPFASDANATDVGNLSVARRDAAGQSSGVSGYTSGGYIPPAGYSNVIDKFPFASNGNSTDVGDLSVARFSTTGQSSNVSGYASGGYSATPASVPARHRTTIDKFPFATDSNATNIGALTLARRYSAGQSSDVSGYTSGGQRAPQPSPPINTFLVNNIDKFPFATDAGATDVGDLVLLSYTTAGQSSTVSGYTSGGYGRTPPGLPIATFPVINRNNIEKFPFATNANATDIADLTVVRSIVAGQSSTVSGYTSGGYAPPILPVSTIDKFPFASDTNATDVGDLSSVRSSVVGQQD